MKSIHRADPFVRTEGIGARSQRERRPGSGMAPQSKFSSSPRRWCPEARCWQEIASFSVHQGWSARRYICCPEGESQYSCSEEGLLHLCAAPVLDAQEGYQGYTRSHQHHGASYSPQRSIDTDWQHRATFITLSQGRRLPHCIWRTTTRAGSPDISSTRRRRTRPRSTLSLLFPPPKDRTP